LVWRLKTRMLHRVKYWESIADNLSEGRLKLGLRASIN
jgi:hypothetical protein